MANGISKLQLLIDLKNKLKVGLDSAKDQVNKATGSMQSKLNAFKVSNIEAFNSIKDEVPGASRAFQMLSNPIVAATATVAALGYGIVKAMNEAEKFSGSFRQLQMLNIDKSVKDMGRLKSMIRSTAYEKGFDPTNTITAFFDVQSITGKYGSEIDRIVSKQGEFANLMQADFNEWISGTAKAMANYGFGADKLDEFNRASFATFKTAKTTFDELAKVQAIYAGAAASAKQDFAAANKMFSIFTLKTKSIDEAATLTKSLFNDLTKAETIKAFSNMGIDVFDVNRKFKQADVLLLELQKKFKELGKSDASLINLKNQFTGSEGLISFVQSATDKTDQLKNTFNSFDATQFALPKALEIAKNDINYINEQLGNRTKVLMTEIGEKFLHIKMPVLELLNSSLGALNFFFTGAQSYKKQLEYSGSNQILDQFPELNKPLELSNEKFTELLGKMTEVAKTYQRDLDANLKFRKDEGYIDRMSATKSMGFATYWTSSGALGALNDLRKQAQVARSQMPSDFNGVPGADGKPTGGTPTPNPLATNLQSTASGSQTKSVTINIDSFIKGFSPTHQSVNGMSKDELERWVTEMFLRVVRSAETTM